VSAGPRTLVVGAGLMGRWHAHAARRCGAVLLAVVDPDARRAADLASRHGAAPAAELGPALRAHAPDVVHACTPLATHAGIVEACLRAGAHVLCEKPLAPDAASTQRLLALAAEAGRQLWPCHQAAFQPFIDRVGALGDVLSIEHVTCSGGAAGRPESELDDVVADILPHPLSVFDRLRPGTLAEARWQVTRSGPGELRAQAVSAGTSLSLHVSLAARPTRHEVRVLARGGSVLADLFHGHVVVEGPHASRAYKVARPFVVAAASLAAAGTNLARRALRNEPAYPGLVDLLRAFHAAVRGEGAPALSPRHVLDVATARDLILAPARSGR
jgi:predicted dehydrogenase